MNKTKQCFYCVNMKKKNINHDSNNCQFLNRIKPQRCPILDTSSESDNDSKPLQLVKKNVTDKIENNEIQAP